MKHFIVEVINETERGLEFGGRNCKDSIRKGDKLILKGRAGSEFLVQGIEVYNREVDELHHGYVGTLFVSRVSGDIPALMDDLISDDYPNHSKLGAMKA